MVATTLKRAGIGFLLGMIVGALIVVFMGFANGGSLVLPPKLVAATGSDAGALLAQMLVSGAFGAIPWAGITFYELDSWSLLKQAVVHYATYTAAFLIIGIGVGWIEPILADMGLMAGIFAVCHAIIWLIMYARYKKETKELNTLVKEAHRKEAWPA